MKHLLLVCLIETTFFLATAEVFASATDLAPRVSEVSKNFSKKFWTSIVNGITPEEAGEIAANQLVKGLLFSPVMKEIMTASKEDLIASLSNNIFDGCGNDLRGTKEELDDYLAQLANKVLSKSTNGFQITANRQSSLKINPY